MDEQTDDEATETRKARNRNGGKQNEAGGRDERSQDQRREM